MNKKKILATFIAVAGLSACGTMENNDYMNYRPLQPTLYQNNYYENYGGVDYDYQAPRGGVTVPDSYHVGPLRSPVSHQEVDKSWVNQQNPQGYTIEVSQGEKASEVARQLHKVPKNDRTAQLKYQDNEGKSYYKGVYGSYNSYEEAQKALNALPDDIKEKAGIKNWSGIQDNAQ
jgi:hypothetical protein